MKSFEKLKTKLAELFQLDQADLDFGIYRIMNARRGEITHFLEQDLLPQIQEAFKEYQSADKALLKQELDKAIEGAHALGMEPESVPKVKELQAEYETSAVDVTAMENEVFDHLCSFFSRYYDEGDFISLRRYKEGVYAIPYEGEEVKLHWANHDQYYIKTTEYFRDYAFKTPSGQRVNFKIAEADTEKDNIKATNGNDRRFLLYGDKPVAEENGELVIRFEYRPDGEKRRQDAINVDTAMRVIADLNDEKLAAWKDPLAVVWKRAGGKETGKTILDKHLFDYTRRNTFDYFIHKDLEAFLRRELDFYVKNEVMRLDDIEEESVPRVEQYLSKIKVIRRIAHKIIDFLAQIENFQKKLWLKKKFVVETNYCVTLDRVPEDLYPEIAANDAQREEWVRLFAIDEIEGDLHTPAYVKPLTVEFLKANDKLVLDTNFFNESFKARLLASTENFDEECDGVLVHSENFQALNLMQARYCEQVQCIYIDPPYNTNATPILYKNEYKSSSWLSLIENRLVPGSRMLKPKVGFSVVAIDDHELVNLSKLIEQVFPSNDLHRVIVNHYPGSGTGRSDVTRTHEYALFSTPRNADILRGEAKEAGWRERGFCRSGTGDNNYRVGRPNSFYAVLVDEEKCKIVGFEPPPHKDERNYPREKTLEGYTRIYPFGQGGSERCWTLSYESAIEHWKKGFLICSPNLIIRRRYHDEASRNMLPSVWIDKKFSAVSYGTNLLTSLFGDSGLFSYPKSLYTVQTAIEAGIFREETSIVMDYFAGSGTTGHAIIDLNRNSDTNHRFILVEMGNYFADVTKPRIQKVIYSKDWKNGKPISREGVSHMFKYIRLESYEDALTNIELQRTAPQQLLLDKAGDFRESYMLKYILDVESRGSQTLLNIDNFDDPWNYKLLVGAGSVGETNPVNVDLVETFNWLLGMKVKHIDRISGFLVVEGENPKGEKVLVIWRKVRDLDETDPDKIGVAREKANRDLETFFRKQQYNTLDSEFDVIYVNGDNNLMNVPLEPDKEGVEPRYKVRLIEEQFKRLMFDVKDI